jgi:anti-sigma-K factor RskA
MELANIERLLEKYLDAETTLQEEQVLQDYFCSDDVAPHLQEHSAMFTFFKQSKDETYTKTIQLTPEQSSKKNWNWLSVAASAVLLLSTSYIGYQTYQQQLRAKQFAQVKEALKLVSSNLNKGNEALYAVSTNLNKGKAALSHLNTYKETVNKAIKTVNY